MIALIPPFHLPRSRYIVIVMILLSLVLSGCISGVSLRDYSDPSGLFSFSYPNGMFPVDLGPSQGPTKLLFRDLVQETENVNLMISPYDQVDRIEEVGSPVEVGQRVADKIIAPAGSGRSATLLNAGALTASEHTYYILEYGTQVGSQNRHDMVTVTINRHELYTLTASTLERRWPQLKDTFYAVAQSFRVA